MSNSAPLKQVTAQRLDGGVTASVTETLAEEVAVALHYNDHSHAVMLATPADLDDFAVGFSLTEGIVKAPGEVTLLEPAWSAHGVALHMRIPALRFALLETRERSLSGRTGCGLCGVSTLEAAIRPVKQVKLRAPEIAAIALGAAMTRLHSQQPFNAASGAVHAAALLTIGGGFIVREDVGRHNAIDKVMGAAARAGQTPHALLVTSRASYEVVHKAAEMGCTLIAAISAPTALAVQLAQQAGLTLVGWARPPRFIVYSGALA